MALNELRIVVVDGGSQSTNSNKSKSQNQNRKESSEQNKDSKLYKMLHWSDQVKEKISNGLTCWQNIYDNILGLYW